MASILHKIKAFLYENFLTSNPNDYVARVSSERSLNVPEICQSAVSRGGADVSAPAMEHSVNLFFKEMGYQLCDGYSVNTGYFTAGTQIRGVFDSPVEKFNSEKHSVFFQFNQGEILRKEIPTIEVNVLGVAENTTFIGQVIDVKTGSVNETLTPNRNLRIAGNKIKIAGNGDTGIYFINQTDNQRTKVDASEIITNNPSEVMIIIPELTPGTYNLQLVTQFCGSVLLKEPRTVTFDKILTV
jgi:hypothetical protein